MPSDYLLVVDGIKGESADAKHPGAIEIDSFSWGESNTGTASSGGGGGAGKVVFQDFSFMTQISTAVPVLFLKCASGEHIKKAQLFVRKAGGEQQEYYTIVLSDVMVTSYQQSAGGDSDPTDSFSLNFGRIELEYKPQNRDGSLGDAVTAGWDLQANKKI